MADPTRPRLIDTARRAEEIAELSRALAEKGFYVLGALPTASAPSASDVVPARPDPAGPAEANG